MAREKIKYKVVRKVEKPEDRTRYALYYAYKLWYFRELGDAVIKIVGEKGVEESFRMARRGLSLIEFIYLYKDYRFDKIEIKSKQLKCTVEIDMDIIIEVEALKATDFNAAQFVFNEINSIEPTRFHVSPLSVKDKISIDPEENKNIAASVIRAAIADMTGSPFDEDHIKMLYTDSEKYKRGGSVVSSRESETVLAHNGDENIFVAVELWDGRVIAYGLDDKQSEELVKVISHF